MIWKNPLKRMMKKKNITIRNPFELLLKQMKELDSLMFKNYNLRTKSGNSKGKIGKLESIPSGMRRFEDNNRAWFFRKFGKSTFTDGASFIKALEKKGFVSLGSGAFSTVLAKPGSKRVLKVIRRPDGWINYVKWAAENGEAGKFAPKVYSYKKIKGKKADFSVAVMERLEYTLDGAPAEHALKIVPDLMWRADKNEMAAKFVNLLAPGLLTFLQKMADEWKIPVGNFDLHSGNLMIRNDGSFVVIDPVSRGADKYNRLRAGDFGPLHTLKLLLMTGFNDYRRCI